MIKIQFTYDGAKPVPTRELTKDEKKTVTSKKTDGGTMEIIYYQGDEPIEPVNNIPQKHPLIEIAMTMTQAEKDEFYTMIKK